MKTIEQASLFKRVVAAVIDALIAVFVFFGLISFVTNPIGLKATKYNDYVKEIYQQEVASHLYVMVQQEDSGKYVVIEVKDYTEKLDNKSYKEIGDIYQNKLISSADYIRYLNYYYTVYLTGDISRVELPSTGEYDPIEDEFVSPTYNVEINGKLPKDIYTARYFNTTIMGLAPEGEENKSQYYEYPVVDEVVNYEGLPVIKEGVDDSKVKEDLRERVYNATKDFVNSDYISSRQKEIRRIQLWEQIPAYVFVIIVFYLVIPLLFKNGETLAKKMLGLGIASSNGYHVKKRQILFRSAVFVVEITFSLFVVGYGLTSVATLGVGCFIMLMVAIFTKKHQAPHDFAAMTVEIDVKKSVFFENANQENRYQKTVQENIDNLNKYEPENPNIIQIGSTIIDERFKPKKQKKSKENKNEK